MNRLLLSCLLGVALLLSGCGLNTTPATALTTNQLVQLAYESSDYLVAASALNASGDRVDTGRAISYQLNTGEQILVLPSRSNGYLIRVVVNSPRSVAAVVVLSADASAIANVSEGWTAIRQQRDGADHFAVGPTTGTSSLHELLSHQGVLQAACAACEDLEEAADEAFEDWMLNLAEAASLETFAIIACATPGVNVVGCAAAISAAAFAAARAVDAEDDYNRALDDLAECQTASNGCSTGGGGTGGGGGGGSGGH